MESGIYGYLSSTSRRVLKVDLIVKSVDQLPLDCGGLEAIEFWNGRVDIAEYVLEVQTGEIRVVLISPNSSYGLRCANQDGDAEKNDFKHNGNVISYEN